MNSFLLWLTLLPTVPYEHVKHRVGVRSHGVVLMFWIRLLFFTLIRCRVAVIAVPMITLLFPTPSNLKFETLVLSIITTYSYPQVNQRTS